MKPKAGTRGKTQGLKTTQRSNANPMKITKYREGLVNPNRRTDAPERIIGFAYDVPTVEEVKDIPCDLCTWVPRHAFGVVVKWQLKFKNSLCELHGEMESVA